MSTLKSRFEPRILKRVGQWIEAVPSRYWESMFFVGLLSYTVVLVYHANQFSSGAGLFPLIVGVPLIGMFCLKLLFTLVLRDRLGQFGGLTSDLMSQQSEGAGNALDDEPAGVHRELESVLWVLLLFGILYLAGFLYGLTVFIFAFVLVKERDLLRAGIVTGSSMLSIYLLFVELLSIQLWSGVIGL